MNFVTRSYLKEFVEIFCRCYSVQKKNHYEVLKLKKNCSARDIKDAFIKMSKEFHPDKNKNVHAQENFVQIVEAYNVLSKPSSRASYDSTIAYHPSHTSSHRNATYAKPRHYHNYNENIYYDQYTTGHTYSHREQAERQHRANQEHYYWHQQSNPRQTQSHAMPRRIPTKYLIFTCLGFAIFGILIEVFVIRYSFLYNKRKAEEKSLQIAEEYKRIRAAALQNGNEMQTRLLLEKIAVGSNPSVATASLGHALASEKKDPAESILAQIGVLGLGYEDPQSAFGHDDI